MTDGWVDYYEILGLYRPEQGYGQGPDASPETIERAWKAELDRNHPDKFGVGSADHRKATEYAKLINEAYRVLRNSWSKEQYDKRWRVHHEGRPQGSKTTPKQPQGAAPPPAIDFQWRPPEAATPQYFYDLEPGQTKEARLSVRPKFPNASKFKVRVEGPLPSWLEVWPLSFVPPAQLKVVVNAGKMPIGDEDEWRGAFELEFALDV